ncbi:MAG: DUF1343 domain-containing protein, partial [Acidobacteria bacterium]|nr:DUF1343 domain-containing protein [Acidobacteriota bacterium]
MNYPRRFMFILFLLLTAACRSATVPPPASIPDATKSRLNAAIERAIADGRIFGGVLYVESGDATYEEVYGLRAINPERETMTRDTIFDVASLTKSIAATPAIMMLVQRGQVELDAPVRRYIPEFRDGWRGEVTVRHLLTHFAGLRPDLDLHEPWEGYDTAMELTMLEEPVNRPGAVFLYSDINFLLVSEIVRRVSGLPLDEFVEKEIYEPLGMAESEFTPDETKRPRIAPTEIVKDGGLLRGVVHDPTSRRMAGVAGHAGLFTTLDDITRYVHMLQNGGELDGVRIFDPEIVRLMTTAQSPPGAAVRRTLGWDYDSNFSRPRGNFPIGSFGHTGWTGSFLWIDPASDTFFVFMSNRVHPGGRGSVLALHRELGTIVSEMAGYETFPDEVNVDPRRGTGSTQNGIDVLGARRYEPLRGKRIGLITNHTGRDRYGNSTIDLLHHAPGVDLVGLFAPEHGIRGDVDADVSDSTDVRTGLPIYSLYGERRTPAQTRGDVKAGASDSTDVRTGLAIYSLYGERRAPAPEHLETLDALVFDIQDIGARFYTYISTMGLAMEAAAEADIEFIVLDRLNPIGGSRVEGPVSPADESRFIAFHPIAVRHGMTVGELASLFREERGLDVDLSIVKLRGWDREMYQDETGAVWFDTSPNIRNLTAASLYPAIGLLERMNVSVGRGTSTPFELFGAPYVDSDDLATALNGAVSAACMTFTP